MIYHIRMKLIVQSNTSIFNKEKCLNLRNTHYFRFFTSLVLIRNVSRQHALLHGLTKQGLFVITVDIVHIALLTEAHQ